MLVMEECLTLYTQVLEYNTIIQRIRLRLQLILLSYDTHCLDGLYF